MFHSDADNVLQIELLPGPLQLQPSQLLRVRNARGWQVRAVSGALWITQDGDRRDIVLGAGDQFLFCSAGLGLISALTQSVLIVDKGPSLGTVAAATPLG